MMSVLFSLHDFWIVSHIFVSAAPFKSALTAHKPKGYWQDINNRRRFFTAYANEMGFDPLDAAKWDSVKHVDLVEKMVQLLDICMHVVTLENSQGYGPLPQFENSLRRALRKTFPEFSDDCMYRNLVGCTH